MQASIARRNSVAANWRNQLNEWFAQFGPPVGLSLFLILLWEGACRLLAIPKFLLPSPSRIVSSMIGMREYIWFHTWITLQESLLGFGIAALVGILLAIAIFHSKFAERTLYPYAVIAKLIPIVAIAPLLTLWFGFGMAPKVIISALISFFPIVVNTVRGLQAADKGAVRLLKSLDASPLEIFLKVRFPYALPYVFASFRIASTLVVIGALVGEFVGADQGLGYLLTIASARMDTASVFGGVVISSLLGVFLFAVVSIIESRLLFWCKGVEATE